MATHPERSAATTVVNVRRASYDVYIGRPGYFGNPIRLRHKGDSAERDRVLNDYHNYFVQRVATDVEFVRSVLTLRGKRLRLLLQTRPLPRRHDRKVARLL